MPTIQYDHTSGSGKEGTAVVPSDTTVLKITRGFWVGGTGDLHLQHVLGTTVIYKNVPVGFFAMSAVRVMLATTATFIVAVR